MGSIIGCTALIAVIIALITLLSASTVDASHFAYGSVSWIRRTTTAVYDYSVEMAFRRDYWSGVNVGVNVDTGAYMYWYPNAGSSYERYSSVVVNVKVVYASDNFFTGIWAPAITLSYTTIKYELRWSLCCRISTLIDGNNDQQAMLYTTHDATQSASPRTSALPRFYFEKAKQASFVVTAQSPQGYTMTFSIATYAKSGLPYVAPFGNPGLTLNPSSGAITWTPTTSGLYAWQVRISDGYSEVPLDVIFQVLDQCTSAQCPNPVFDPPTPVDQTYYRGVSRTNNIVAKCSDTTSTVTVTNSPLPTGASFTLTSQVTSTSTYALQWQPDLSQPSFVVCFQATESRRGLMSLGNYCVNMVIGTASIIYISGIARDFVKAGGGGQTAAYYGMNIALQTADQPTTTTTYISSTLQSTGKPLYSSGATTIGGGATGFNWWWNTDAAGSINKEVVVSTTLSNGTNQDYRVFTFATPSFYPLDGLGFLNDGDSHNKYWTYEVHTYITYNGGEIFNLASSDDLWIFFDGKLAKQTAAGGGGWPMGGIHQYTASTATVALNDQGLTVGQTYRCDLFYACRSSSHDCALKLELPGAVLCDAIQSGTVILDGTQPFASGSGSSSNIVTFGAAAISSPYLLPMTAASASASGAAWYQGGTGVAQRVQLLHGFSMTFDFIVPSISNGLQPEGFAVVFQSQSTGARGGEAGNLGYSTLTNSLAVEFDMNTNTDQGDPLDTCSGGNGQGYQHISFHTNKAGANSANEKYSIGASICPSTSKLTLTMANNTWHRVKITFTPAKEDPAGGPQLGWLRVFMGIANADGSQKTTVIAPLAEAQIDGVVLQSMWPGGAPYVGFTASSSDSNAANIQIRNWALTIVPASSATTTSTGPVADIRAGQTGTLLVQMKDACANRITTGGDAADFASAGVTRAAGSSPSVVPVTIVDQLTGIYAFTFAPTYTGTMRIPVTLKGSAILGSPFQVIVKSDVTVASKSSSIYTPQIDMARSNSPKQSSIFVLVVDATYGDVISSTGYDLTSTTDVNAIQADMTAIANGRIVAVAFAGTVAASTIPSAVASKLADVGAVNAATAVSGSSYCSIQVKGGTYSSTYDLSVAADATGTMKRTFTAFSVWCWSAGALWGNYGNIIVVPTSIAVPAGTTAKVWIEARDQYNNLNTDGGDAFKLSFSPDISTLGGINAVTTPTNPFSGYYMATFTCTVAGTYQQYVQLDNVNIIGSPATITVVAGVAVASKSTPVASPGLVTAVAGTATYMDFSLYDGYGNAVTSVNRNDVIPLPTLTSGVNVITATSCSFVGVLYRCYYTATYIGTYSISIIVNGAAITTTLYTPTVIAGNPTAAASQSSALATVNAGETISFYIQARDQFNNTLLVAATSSYVFTSTFTLPTAIDTVLIGSASPWAHVHDSLGRYQMKYVPKVAGTFVLSSFLNGVAIGKTGSANPLTVTINPGAAADSSVLTLTTTTITAGQTYTGSLLSKDRYGNIRSVAPFDGATAYVYKFATKSGVDYRGTTSVAYTTNGIYTLSYSATKTGTYLMTIQTTSGSGIVNSAAADITVVPAATNSASCSATGSGLTSAVQNTAATFIIAAFDIYSNAQLNTVVDNDSTQFVITVDSVVLSASARGAAGANGNQGQVIVTYTAPAKTSFPIQVTRGGTTIYSGTVIGYANSQESYTRIENIPTPAICGQWNSFRLHNVDAQGNDKPGPDPAVDGLPANTMLVSIYNALGYTVPLYDPIASPDGLKVTPAQANATTIWYTVWFLPIVAGQFNITVKERSTFLSRQGPQPMTIIPGGASISTSKVTGLPAQVVAGTKNSYTVTVTDAYNQPLTSCSGLAITATIGVELAPVTISCPCVVGSLPSIVCWYNITTASYADSQWDVTTYVNGQAILGGALALVVIPDVPAPSNSLVTVGGPYVAGTTVVSAFTIQDQWGNAIKDKLTESLFAFSVNDGVTTAASFDLQFLQPYYQLSFSTEKAGTWVFSMKYNSLEIGSSTKSLVITPTDISADNSFVTLQNTPVAGQPLTLTLNARDTFNNPWKNEVGAIGAIVTSPAGNPNLATATSTGSGGIYTLTFAGIYTQQVGDYTWQFTADGRIAFVPTGMVASKTIAGPVDPQQTTIDGTIPAGRVGVSNSVTIYLRDQYGNLITGGTQQTIVVDAMIGQLKCADRFESGELDLINGVPNPALANATTRFSQRAVTSFTPSTGAYVLSFTTQTLGTYTLNLTINGAYLNCRKTVGLSFSVAAGVVSPTLSYYSRLPVSFAGVGYTVTVTLRDIYGNYFATIPADTVVSFGYYSGVSTSTTDGNYTSGVLPTSDTSIWFANDGLSSNTTRRYISSAFISGVTTTIGDQESQPIVFTVMSYDAGNFVWAPSVTSTGQPKARITGAGLQNFWQVLPGVPSAFSAVTQSLFGTPTAGKPESFYLYAQDAYGNAVTDASSHTFRVSFRGTGTVTLYSFEATVTAATLGRHLVSYLSQYSGSFELDVYLITPSKTTTLPYGPYYVQAATCAAEIADSPYRCPNRTCVSDYSQCTEIVSAGGICPSSTPIRCASDNSCVATTATCPCPSGYTKCADGSCLSSASACMPISTCPSTAPYACQLNGVSTGQCRASSADCPTSLVCTPGYVVCPSSTTCARDLASCDTTTAAANCTTLGQFRCASGQCVSRTEDCGTPKTCPTARPILCADGSCTTSSSLCADQYPCYDPAPYRCYDGSCRQSFDQCPTPVTCPVGWVLCESGACASSLSACPTLTGGSCTADEVRCSDGSCVANEYFCPSDITCLASKPVKCYDGSCQASVYLCPTPSTCSSGYICPDGTCAAGASQSCPTTMSCAAATPLLCPDGTCTASLSLCVQPPSCPVATPYRCPEGSCRGNLNDCPSQTSCSTTYPIKCADGTCAVAQDQCNVLPECDTGYIRCPGGECAPSTALCPTHVTCAVGTSKCVDGTCRYSCTSVTAPICPGAQITCPQAGFGVQCAASLDQCPQAPVCPVAKPVKCIDVTCAASVSLCPAVPTSYPDNKVACADGSWQSDISQCPTATTCPSAAPYKCYDDSCRTDPYDCPVTPSCNGTTPYLCPNGVCAATLWATNCQSASIVCGTDVPVKCTDGSCAGTLAQCPSKSEIATSASCPSTWTRCRDGSCVSSASYCIELTCPVSLPYRCDDGLCTTSSAFCNSASGCPYNKPNKCSFGLCVVDLKNCTALASSYSCPSGQVSCPDGSCRSNAADCPAANGCRSSQRACADKSCVAKPASGVNLCVAGVGSSSGTGSIVIANACDLDAPYQCPTGFCATTKLLCPKLSVGWSSNGTYGCPTSFPAQCADGSCVVSLEQCPIIKPCTTSGYMRCGDGSCRVTGECPLVDTCPYPLARCSSGLCSPVGECIDITTGCVAGYQKCSNGACIPTTSSCTTYATQANGCPSATPYKCWDGECTTGDDSCRRMNGCPAATPFRCTKDNACVAAIATCDTAAHQTTCDASTQAICADGSCPAAGATACLALNGCPASKPSRCGDGSCATSTAACPTTVVCDTAAGEVLCYDGTCVSSYTQCSSSAVCLANEKRCADQSCVLTTATCPTGLCPGTSPVLCPTGVCKSTLASCPSTSSSGTIGGSGSGTGQTGTSTDTSTSTTVDLTRPSCSSTQYECFDGSCRASLMACQNWNAAVTGASSSESVVVCGTNMTLCANGGCVTNEYQCPVVPSCPLSRPLRCWDGTCVNTTASTCSSSVSCSSGYSRCEDGACRTKCLQFDGCPLSKPYHCPNRECATSLSGCAAAVSFDMSLVLKRRLLQSGSSSSSSSSTGSSGSSDPSVCYTNCVAETKSTYIEYTVDPTTTNTVAIALDTSRAVEAQLTIAGGSLVKNSQGTSSDALKIYIHPVGDSRMRDSVNRVTISRRGSFGTYMTYPATLLSPAFECAVDDYITQPFRVPIEVSASIDMTRAPLYGDICLAYIYHVDSVNWAGWKCVDATESERLSNPVRDAKSNYTDPVNVVQGTIYYCNSTEQLNAVSYVPRTGSIYGFVHAPARRTDLGGDNDDTFWRDNLIWIVLGICAFGAIAAGVVYCAKRLHRYRLKYKTESDKVAKAQEEVDNMEQFGGQAGTKDEQLEMMANPMVVQMQQMQARLDRKNAEVLAEEKEQREKESAARQEHIGNLQSDRDKLQAELERLKAELALSASQPTATAVVVDTPSSTNPAGGSRPAAKKPATARTDFDTGRPGGQKKKKDVD